MEPQKQDQMDTSGEYDKNILEWNLDGKNQNNGENSNTTDITNNQSKND